jgi:hypothetical protein
MNKWRGAVITVAVVIALPIAFANNFFEVEPVGTIAYLHNTAGPGNRTCGAGGNA